MISCSISIKSLAENFEMLAIFDFKNMEQNVITSFQAL